ncbi:MAG: serine/threonine-protein kinase [Myxococcales bacterium]|nr:serine/threonine-protein kinase [Myxococcales bacterium]
MRAQCTVTAAYESAPAGTVTAGTTLAGRYAIERLLGQGGMAEVYAAHDRATGRSVAIKLLRREVAGNAEAVERLRREGAVLASLRHPSIVAIETYGQLEDGRLFLVMERLHGETLGARMRRLGPLQPPMLVPIVQDAVAALAAAHARGVIHRDLKPDNLFLVETEERPVVKLLDFGISKVVGDSRITATGEVLGTPRYMAPEQLRAEPDLDARTDVYAMGVVLFEALAGTSPFLAPTPSELLVAILQGRHPPLRSFRPDLPEAIEAVVARAMARTREARFSSIEELGQAFVRAARGSVIAPATSSPRISHATAPVGSFEAPGERDRPSSPGRIVPGTFGALSLDRPAPALSPAGAPIPPGPRPTPETAPAPRDHAAPASRAAPLPSTAKPHAALDEPVTLPSNRSTLALWLGALGAGALFGVLVVAGLRACGA